MPTSCGNIQKFEGKKSLLFSNNEFFATGHLIKWTIVVSAPWQCKLCNIGLKRRAIFFPRFIL
jgi:hypothetical protein